MAGRVISVMWLLGLLLWFALAQGAVIQHDGSGLIRAVYRGEIDNVTDPTIDVAIAGLANLTACALQLRTYSPSNGLMQSASFSCAEASQFTYVLRGVTYYLLVFSALPMLPNITTRENVELLFVPDADYPLVIGDRLQYVNHGTPGAYNFVLYGTGCTRADFSVRNNETGFDDNSTSFVINPALCFRHIPTTTSHSQSDAPVLIVSLALLTLGVVATGVLGIYFIATNKKKSE